MRDKEVTIARQRDDGVFVVVELGREQYGGNRAPMFSFTFSEYPSRTAWEMRNDNSIFACGSSDEAILSVAPELAWLVPLHGCWTDNGEPTHVSNGWYWMTSAPQREIETRAQGRKNHYNAPDDTNSEEWVLFWLGLACNAMRCELHELSAIDLSLPEDEARALFDEFVDDVLRPRWQAEADKANEFLDAYEGDHRPEEDRDEPLFEHTFENGLKLRATLDEHDEHDDRYWYYVTITAPGVKQYRTRYGGSNVDHWNGRVSAREAAFGTAKELFTYQFEDAEGAAVSMGEDWLEMPAETRNAMQRASEAFDRFENFLIPNQEVIGS
jgi:hypothetical protein